LNGWEPGSLSRTLLYEGFWSYSGIHHSRNRLLSAVNSLLPWRSSVRMPTEAADCFHLQNAHKYSATPSASYSTDTKGSFRRNKAIGPEMATHHYGVPISGATPPLHPHTFIVWKGTNSYATMYPLLLDIERYLKWLLGYYQLATSISRCNPMWFLSVGLRQGSGLYSSSSRKYPGTEGTNQIRHWNHHRWDTTNSLERTRLSCWCSQNHKGCTYRAPIRYVTKTWNVVLLNKKKNTYTPITSLLCMTSC